MREVAIVGVGMHPWGKFPDKEIVDMCVDSTLLALKDANVEWKEVGGIAAGCWPWAGTGSPGLVLGNRMTERLGETGIPVVNIYNACATPIAVIREIANMIALGEIEVGLALAADKSPGGFFFSTYEHPQDPYYIRSRMVGMTNPTTWALWARRRMHEVGTTQRHFAMVKEKNSRNGVLNPYARYKRVYSIEETLASPVICDPLHLYDICATSDGAAAVVLCAMDKAHKYSKKPIKVSGAAVASSSYGDPTLRLPYQCVSARDSLPVHSEIRNAARLAFKKANLKPADMNVIELHDACTYHELAYLEAIMDLQTGEADRMLENGVTRMGGKLPVNPSGGSCSMGEAVAAQGIAQVCELTWQLRGEAGERQVKGAKAGLGQTYGAYGNCSVVVLEKGY